MRTFTLGLCTAALLFAQSAFALTIESVTSVTDDNGGSLSITSSGSAFSDGGNSDTNVLASSFSPRGEAALSGEINRSRSRGAESVTSTYNGEFDIAGSDAEGNPVNINVVLSDLTVVREGEGPVFSGTVTINGNVLDASDLPEPAARIVRRALRLFVFA